MSEQLHNNEGTIKDKKEANLKGGCYMVYTFCMYEGRQMKIYRGAFANRKD